MPENTATPTAAPGQGAAGCSPRDFMNSVRELYSEWLELARRDDPSLVRLPDFEAAMDYVEAHGIGPCQENATGERPETRSEDT